MWEQKIEEAYQRWISSQKLLGDSYAVEKFYKFVWACIDDHSNAPDESALGERLERDRKLKRDEKNFPHPDRTKAQSLYNHLRAFVEAR